MENYYSSRGKKVYDVNFGDHVDYDMHLEKYLNVRGLSCATDSKIFKLLQYDLDHEIFAHSNDPNAPPDFSLVSLHDTERVIDPFSQRVLDFVRNEVHKNTGLTLADFVMLPRHMQDEIVSVIDNERSIRIRETEQATREAQRDLSNSGS